MGYQPPQIASLEPTRARNPQSTPAVRDPRVTGALGYEKGAAMLRPPQERFHEVARCLRSPAGRHDPAQCLTKSEARQGEEAMARLQRRPDSDSGPTISARSDIDPRLTPTPMRHGHQPKDCIESDGVQVGDFLTLAKLGVGLATGGLAMLPELLAEAALEKGADMLLEKGTESINEGGRCE